MVVDLLAAVERWRDAEVGLSTARVEVDAARVELTAALHALGVVGFSL